MTQTVSEKAAQNRRPLKSRGNQMARWLAQKLASSWVTPNHVSIAGLVAAGAAGLLLWWVGEGANSILLIAAALFVQMRLLCNLIDGMVAVEGGKAAPDGPFWNEVPDRLADILIIVGFGYAAGMPGLGWAASALAIFTAYLRAIGEANHGLSDFSGPMAKPHRMALITGTAVVASLDPVGWGGLLILQTGLWILVIGTAITALRRCIRLHQAFVA